MNSNQTNYRFYCEISYNKTIKRILQKPFVLDFTLLGMVNWFILFAIEKTNIIQKKYLTINNYFGFKKWNNSNYIKYHQTIWSMNLHAISIQHFGFSWNKNGNFSMSTSYTKFKVENSSKQKIFSFRDVEK